MSNEYNLFNGKNNENININDQRKEDESENSIEEEISTHKTESLNEKNMNKESEKQISIKGSQNIISDSDFKNDELISFKVKPDIDNDNEIKNKLINELIEKEKLLEQIVTSNNNLKSQIDYSNKKYEEILAKMKNQEKDELNIESLIKKIDNDIKEFKLENNKYKKEIKKLKNKLELKDIIENQSNIKTLLQSEQDKNKELKNKLSNIKNINLAQKKYINHFEKNNKIKEKIIELKSEIENEKDSIKVYQERYIKIDNFNTMISNEIKRIKSVIKNLEEKKVEEVKKIFTEEELNDTKDVISNLRNIIIEKRNNLNNLCKNNDEKMYKILSQNKIVESEINENIRMNKLLICKRNELKRIIKTKLYK